MYTFCLRIYQSEPPIFHICAKSNDRKANQNGTTIITIIYSLVECLSSISFLRDHKLALSPFCQKWTKH